MEHENLVVVSGLLLGVVVLGVAVGVGHLGSLLPG